ncbi:hypothetical protein SNE40_006470 [Patella caerulea]|uniref:Uncharacterized protein n=1 Tax=Patella caerulea TaxID=87958 RepID=A0AAN8PTM7_PATCE
MQSKAVLLKIFLLLLILAIIYILTNHAESNKDEIKANHVKASLPLHELMTSNKPLPTQQKITTKQPLPSQQKMTTKQPLPKIYAIVTMPLLTKKDLQTKKYRTSTTEKIEERMSEFITGLQNTLNHECVYRVHFLYNESNVVDYVKAHVKINTTKLVFNRVEDPRKHVTYFDFAYEKLQGEIAMYTPIDVYPGEGFRLINKDDLISKKLMYILTRHGKQEKNCDMGNISNNCNRKRYFGSHDSYIFVPNGPLSPEIRKALDYWSIVWGQENIAIHTFRTLGHFKVTNPCEVLFVYHIHCSNLRDSTRYRINTSANSGMAPPTNTLT